MRRDRSQCVVYKGSISLTLRTQLGHRTKLKFFVCLLWCACLYECVCMTYVQIIRKMCEIFSNTQTLFLFVNFLCIVCTICTLSLKNAVHSWRVGLCNINYPFLKCYFFMSIDYFSQYILNEY